MKKVFSITVHGQSKDWSFQTVLDDRHAQDWSDDGIEIHEVTNTIPEWIAVLGLSRPWCFLQNLFWIPLVR